MCNFSRRVLVQNQALPTFPGPTAEQMPNAFREAKPAIQVHFSVRIGLHMPYEAYATPRHAPRPHFDPKPTFAHLAKPDCNASAKRVPQAKTCDPGAFLSSNRLAHASTAHRTPAYAHTPAHLAPSPLSSPSSSSLSHSFENFAPFFYFFKNSTKTRARPALSLRPLPLLFVALLSFFLPSVFAPLGNKRHHQQKHTPHYFPLPQAPTFNAKTSSQASFHSLSSPANIMEGLS